MSMKKEFLIDAESDGTLSWRRRGEPMPVGAFPFFATDTEAQAVAICSPGAKAPPKTTGLWSLRDNLFESDEGLLSPRFLS